MKSKGLSITIIFNANSANYSEGFGNISTLKKLNRGDGNVYTYISRQALRYSLVKSLGWDNTAVAKDKVVQFAPDAYIDEFPEIDFFGYMKTKNSTSENKGGADTRAAVCRLSHAIALEPYKSDLDFLTNMGLSQRLGENENSIAQSEIHQSLYAYTVAIDLDLVGIDGDIEIPNKEKAERTKKLLSGIKFLYRDIKGRRENLTPLFAVGGIYNQKNPFFEGRTNVKDGNLLIKPLEETLNLDSEVKENTLFGYIGSIFNNEEEISTLKTIGIGEFFTKLDERVDAYYESN